MSSATSTLPWFKTNSRLQQVAIVIGGSLILAVSAQIATPFMPVPTTLQTYALLAMAALFGPRVAVAMTLAYFAEGLVGLPVFASFGRGPAVFVGLTAGYLLAFPAAAALVGRLHQRTRSLVASFALMVVGHVVVIAGGVAWLALQLGLTQALVVGALPFIAGTLVKSVLATVTVALVRRRRA